jgi:hypothetical protein
MIMKKVIRRIVENQPQWPDTHDPKGHEELTVELTFDSVTTVAALLWDEEPVAFGIARRRRTDERNAEIGISLALARCLRHASEKFAEQADSLLHPELDDMDRELRRMHKISKQRAAERKNERRAKARERYASENPVFTEYDHA